MKSAKTNLCQDYVPYVVLFNHACYSPDCKPRITFMFYHTK